MCTDVLLMWFANVVDVLIIVVYVLLMWCVMCFA
jgi:hypothetical protein